MTPTIPRRVARLSALALSVGLLSSATGFAQTAQGAPSIITAAELAARLDDPTLVLLHVGSAPGYRAGHIRAARHVTPALLSTPHGEGRLTLELPDEDDLRTSLLALGINDTSEVVVYYAEEWVSQATRVIFTLDYAGLGGRTHLLEGGLAAWTAAGRPVTDTSEPPVTAPGELTLRTNPAAVIGLDALEDLVGSGNHDGPRATVIVDARSADFYTGANNRRGEIRRPGHIPGAVNLPYTDFFTPAVGADKGPLVLKPRTELEAMFAAAGITRGTKVVTYCHIGQQATVPFLVARLLGYNVRLYDGSFEQWDANTSLPVEK